MADLTVKKIISSHKPDGKQYTITTFLTTNDEVYETLGRIEEGKSYSGTVEEKYGKKNFKKDQPAGGNFGSGGKDNPEQRASIEWQSSYKAAVEVTRDYFTFRPDLTNKITIEEYAKEVDKLAIHFKKVIELKPEPVKAIAPSVSDDQPPVDNYEDEEIADKAAGAFFERLG